MTTVDLRLGDCQEILPTLAAGSVGLTVTSPPYDNLRQYEGYEFDYEATARELWRLTKPGGVVVWIVGDATIDGSETGTSFRQALYFKMLGFNLHDTMIYQKVYGASGSNLAYWQSFEYMFVFSKGRPSTVNLIHDRKNVEPPKIEVNKAQGHRLENGDKKPKRTIVRREYGIRHNIWELHMADTSDKGYDHPAVFPEELARDHILSWSNPGDTVLDPMMGSGTTGKMAVKFERNFIGCEISPRYFAIAQRRIAQAQAQLALPLFGPAAVTEAA